MKKHIGIYYGEDELIEALRTDELYKPWLVYYTSDGSLHNTDIMFIEGTLDGNSDCQASIAWTGATLTATFDCFSEFYYNVVTNDDLEFSDDSGYGVNATIYVTAGTNSEYSARTLSFDIEFRQEENGSVYYTLHYVITQAANATPRVQLSGELWRHKLSALMEVPYFAYNTDSINISTSNLSDEDSYIVTMRNGSNTRVSLTAGTGNINYDLATTANTTTGVRTFNGATSTSKNDIEIQITADSTSYVFDLAPVLLPNNAGIFTLGDAGDSFTESTPFNQVSTINMLIYPHGGTIESLGLVEVSGSSYQGDWTYSTGECPIGYVASVTDAINYLDGFTMALQAVMATGDTIQGLITKGEYKNPGRTQSFAGSAYTHTGVASDGSDSYIIMAGSAVTTPRVTVGAGNLLPTDEVVTYNPYTSSEVTATGKTSVSIQTSLPRTATTSELTWVGDGTPYEVTVSRNSEQIFHYEWSVYRAPNAPCMFREDAPLDGDLCSAGLTEVTFKSIVRGSYTLTSVSGAPASWTQTISGNDVVFGNIATSGSDEATTTITATYTDANSNTATYSIDITYYE